METVTDSYSNLHTSSLQRLQGVRLLSMEEPLPLATQAVLLRLRHHSSLASRILPNM